MSLPNIEGFDWNIAKEYLESDEIVAEIAKGYIEDEIDGVISDLEKYFLNLEDAESIKNYCIKAHSVKSSFKMLGNMTLSDYAKELEFAAKENDIIKIRTLHQGLIDRMKEAAVQLKALS